MHNFPERVSSVLALCMALLFVGCSSQRKLTDHTVLVSPAWLQSHLTDPDLLVLHAGTAEIYDSVHIPGARLIVPYRFAIDTDSIRYEMPQADSIVALLREAGVNNDSRVVLYYEDRRHLTRAARVFVTMDRVGLGNRTFLLNGGLPAWREEKREVTARVPEFEAGNLELSHLNEVVITAGELDRQRWSPKIVVIDARTPEEYYGTPASENKEAEGGHIEGARSLPYQDFLEEGRSYLFRPDSILNDLTRNAGMDPHKQVVVYCGSGGRASVSYLVAKHLGYPVLLFDGSYAEWTRLGLPFIGPVAQPDSMEKKTGL
jgi:thiosulfate/3-mercaptopyruvate sulfurtransferase